MRCDINNFLTASFGSKEFESLLCLDKMELDYSSCFSAGQFCERTGLLVPSVDEAVRGSLFRDVSQRGPAKPDLNNVADFLSVNVREASLLAGRISNEEFSDFELMVLANYPHNFKMLQGSFAASADERWRTKLREMVTGRQPYISEHYNYAHVQGLLPFVRLRPERLERNVRNAIAASRNAEETEKLGEMLGCLELGKLYGWGMGRCVGSALYSMVAPPENMTYFKTLLADGVAALTDEEYLTMMKERHDLDRQCCSLGPDPVEPHVLSRSLYLHTLAGRGGWEPRFNLMDEIKDRKNMPRDMKRFNGVEMTAKNYYVMREEQKRLMGKRAPRLVVRVPARTQFR